MCHSGGKLYSGYKCGELKVAHYITNKLVGKLVSAFVVVVDLSFGFVCLFFNLT